MPELVLPELHRLILSLGLVFFFYGKPNDLPVTFSVGCSFKISPFFQQPVHVFKPVRRNTHMQMVLCMIIYVQRGKKNLLNQVGMDGS